MDSRISAPVFLVPLNTSHIDHVMTWVNDPEVVKNFQNFGATISREDELRFIEKMAASPDDRIFSLFNESREYVGQGGINQISWANKLGRLSIFIAKSQQHKGYGREAVKALVDKAFAEVGMNKVWLMAYASNSRAIAMYEKVGFQREGLLRQEYFWKGTYHDICRMGILKEEWNKG
jgi:UDP-4-amino-4,6-dideoxy-N-acetyl-beta-L-altrosamine N-acetyltransferase